MKPALQIDEDLEFERAEWRVERVATWAIAGLMLAAGLGLFGRGGPLATGVAGDRDSALWVEYDRFRATVRPPRFWCMPTPASRTGVSSPWL